MGLKILHTQCAVEIASLGSLSKAAESLLIAQPNISRSIKELEADLGITVFNRSAKGMVLTPEGEEFIGYAQNILKQIDEVEMFYKQGAFVKQKFSVSVPRACYISEAFAAFSKSVSNAPAEIFYTETNSQQTVKNVLNNDYRIGIIRYAENHDKFFKAMLEEKGLCYELVAEFKYVLLISAENPLAQKENIVFDDLLPFTEVVHADSSVSSLPLAKVTKDELSDNSDRKIYLFERSAQFDILSDNPETFMWVSPVSQKILDRYGLVQKKCIENRKKYKDMLIYKNGYRFSDLDKNFITSLIESRRKNIN